MPAGGDAFDLEGFGAEEGLEEFGGQWNFVNGKKYSLNILS